MPWFPEFVSAVELARLQTRAARQADPVGQYVDALNKGDTHLLETVWPGEVVVYDPPLRRGPRPLAAEAVRQAESILARRAPRPRRDGGLHGRRGHDPALPELLWDLRHGTDGALHGDRGHPVARQAAGRADVERAPVSRTARDCRS
jgi:hypothetical protein